MGVFLIILIFGAQAVQVGPLPMSYTECVDRALDEGLQPFEDAWKDGKVLEVEGKVVTRADVSARCEIRPKNAK